jgi:DNA polymerase alpha subunit B
MEIIFLQVELDLSELRECCLFPGQLVAVEGLNLTEDLLKVHDIFSGSFVPTAKPPHLSDDLSIVIAAGPFTLSNDLNYQPLWELMSQIAEEEPHVLILIGPFLDHAHPLVQNDELTCTFQEFFNRIVAKIKNYVTG